MNHDPVIGSELHYRVNPNLEQDYEVKIVHRGKTVMVSKAVLGAWTDGVAEIKKMIEAGS